MSDTKTMTEWREHIGMRIMHAMTCAHNGDDFGPRAVCRTCFENTQRIGAILEAEVTAARTAALTKAADAWQWGQWADAPRCTDRVQERIANAQFVTDWLRARAAAAADDTPGGDE